MIVAWATIELQQLPGVVTLIHSWASCEDRPRRALDCQLKVPSHFASGKEIEIDLVIFFQHEGSASQTGESSC